MASPSSIITRGYGTPGSAGLVVTRGYGAGAIAATFGGLFRRALWSWARLFTRPPVKWNRTFRRALPSWSRVWRWKQMANELPAVTLTKPESEDRDFGFDFSDSPEVQSGATLSSAVVVGAPTGLTFGTPRVNETFDGISSGKVAVVEISGGTDENSYAFAVKATLSTGRKLVIPARLVVTGDTE